MKPVRMCAVCREMKTRDDLIRIARGENNFFIDSTNKGGGRGAYICKSKACVSIARKKNVFERSFSSGFPSAIYDKLEELFENEE